MRGTESGKSRKHSERADHKYQTSTEHSVRNASRMMLLCRPACSIVAQGHPLLLSLLEAEPRVRGFTKPLITVPLIIKPLLTEALLIKLLITKPLITKPLIRKPLITGSLITGSLITGSFILEPLITKPLKPRWARPHLSVAGLGRIRTVRGPTSSMTGSERLHGRKRNADVRKLRCGVEDVSDLQELESCTKVP